MRTLRTAALGTACCIFAFLPALAGDARARGVVSFYDANNSRLILVDAGRGVIQLYSTGSQKITLIDQRDFVGDQQAIRPPRAPEPLPTVDAPGADLPGIPRPEGGVRIADQGKTYHGSLSRSVTYLVEAEPITVIPALLARLGGWERVSWELTRAGSSAVLKKGDQKLSIKVRSRRKGEYAEVTLSLESQ
ncbi:MAG TPA: hypothetical protein ENK10_04360 [Acidobacteria bacterium]|nr:hypothetical protein [Acidobacteriota bacterium]